MQKLNTRSIVEVLTDCLQLVWQAFVSPKGIELLDELAQVLGLPDFFPNVDGLQSDDAPQPANSKSDALDAAERMIRSMAVGVQSDAAGDNDKPMTFAELKAARDARNGDKQ